MRELTTSKLNEFVDGVVGEVCEAFGKQLAGIPTNGADIKFVISIRVQQAMKEGYDRGFKAGKKDRQ